MIFFLNLHELCHESELRYILAEHIKKNQVPVSLQLCSSVDVCHVSESRTRTPEILGHGHGHGDNYIYIFMQKGIIVK